MTLVLNSKSNFPIANESVEEMKDADAWKASRLELYPSFSAYAPFQISCLNFPWASAVRSMFSALHGHKGVRISIVTMQPVPGLSPELHDRVQKDLP